MSDNPIRALREKRRWTQAELAERVMVARETVWRWEHGRRPQRWAVRLLAAAFRLDARKLQEEIDAYYA